MKKIKGITWDHPRGYQPLRAAVKEWSKQNTTCDLIWDVRSLKDFGDYPIDKLCETYDLILVDHPFMGDAADKEILLPLDRYLSDSFIQLQQQESIGKSFESYIYHDHLWALPIDSAAQVAAYRRDLFEDLQLTPPATIDELDQFTDSIPAGRYLGIPLCPTDMWCVFLTLCAQYSEGKPFQDNLIDSDAAISALNTIKRWKEKIHPESLRMNPIQMLNYMSRLDDIVYIPYIFGYSNYSKTGFSGKTIHFRNSPVSSPDSITTLLGGVGIAISSKSIYIDESLNFIELILSKEIQKGLYYCEGGQPAHNSAWQDEAINLDCNNYFRNIRQTIDKAYMRPRHVHFNNFQEKAAELLHHSMSNQGNSKKIILEINDLYNRICFQY